MQPQALIDFALYGGAGHENLDEIAESGRGRCVAFKTFLQPPPPGALDEFFGLWCTDDRTFATSCALCAATGLRHCFHCESAGCMQRSRPLEPQAGVTGRAHAESRPPIVEELSVAIVLALAAEAKACPSVWSTVEPAIGRAGRATREPAASTPPSRRARRYLFFTDEALDRLGPFAKCNPPLRMPPTEVVAFGRRVRDGHVVTSGPTTRRFWRTRRPLRRTNIFRAPPGLCGLEVMVPLMLTAVADGTACR